MVLREKSGTFHKIYRHSVTIVTAAPVRAWENVAADYGPVASSIINGMATTKRPTDVHLYKQFRADNMDHAAFEALYGRYYPPNGDPLEWKGENLVDVVRHKYHINGFDADDIVADCWADLTINQPDIRRCFRAFVYQKLEWLIGDYWEKRRWTKPWKPPKSGESLEEEEERKKKEPEEKFLADALACQD